MEECQRWVPVALDVQSWHGALVCKMSLHNPNQTRFEEKTKSVSCFLIDRYQQSGCTDALVWLRMPTSVAWHQK